MFLNASIRTVIGIKFLPKRYRPVIVCKMIICISFSLSCYKIPRDEQYSIYTLDVLIRYVIGKKNIGLLQKFEILSIDFKRNQS